MVSGSLPVFEIWNLNSMQIESLEDCISSNSVLSKETEALFNFFVYSKTLFALQVDIIARNTESITPIAEIKAGFLIKNFKHFFTKPPYSIMGEKITHNVLRMWRKHSVTLMRLLCVAKGRFRCSKKLGG